MPTFQIAILFCVFVVILSGVYVWLHRREQKLLRELDETKRQAMDGAFLEKRLKEIKERAIKSEKRLLDEAQHQAEHVVDEAKEKADESLTVAQKQASDIKSEAQEEAVRSVAETKAQVEQLAAGAEQQAKQLLEEAARAMQKAQAKFEQESLGQLEPVYDKAAKDVAEATATLGQKTQELFTKLETEMMAQITTRQQELDARMSDEWSQVRQEIKDYKAQKQQELDEWKSGQMESISQTILNIISDTLKETIHITLTPKEHQQLVFEALEQAKESHAFDEPA